MNENWYKACQYCDEEPSEKVSNPKTSVGSSETKHTQIIYDKQHYIQQMRYVCSCVAAGMAHGLMEIIVDNFAGGGGASTGIEMATGYHVYAAINHDPEAIRMHKANHRSTRHYCESVWNVNPLEVCNGHPVGLVWFSPDCKHFSKAKGGKPKNKTIRGLAWVALRWAGLVRPRVIMLENVEEFKDWGPLNRARRPIKSKKGITFRRFVEQLKNLGYVVEYRELVAADYGAPTTRKRFFLVARCDGRSIVWPERTHAPAGSVEVIKGICKPYLGAYTKIDFTRPCPSIFSTKQEILKEYGLKAVRPLAENTMRRIARGLYKFVLNNPEPFIVPTIGKHYVCTSYITPWLIQYHSETTTDGVRGQDLAKPILTIDGSNRYGLVSAFLMKYYGQGTGQKITEPLDTITGVDRFGLIEIHGVNHQIVDIGLRMLEPEELYGCMGFPNNYIFDRDCDGMEIRRSEQVLKCGNAVSPPIPAALVRMNLSELCTRRNAQSVA